MDSTSWASDPHWQTFWGQLTIDFIGGVLGAIAFLFLVLWLFRPRVKLANFLCKHKGFYYFKFVNRSFFYANEIKVELHEMKRIPMGNGNHNRTMRKLTLVNSDILYIPGKSLFGTDKTYPHCVTVRTQEDITSILEDENCAVLVKIGLKHGLTGIPDVFEADYIKDQIRHGQFKPGPIFAVHK